MENQNSLFAETILHQLGGRKFIAMTGASNFVKDEQTKTMSFKIGRNSSGANFIKIRLTSMDVYEMTFIKFRGIEMKIIKTCENLYNDMLEQVFTSVTGLNTRII